MIRLHVVGVPAPQGSKSAIVGRNGRAVIVEGKDDGARARHRSWRAAVTQAARDWLTDHPQSALAEPVRVSFTFRFPVVKSDPFRTFHITRPDGSKVQRAVEDALVDAGLLADDSLIWSWSGEKRYCAAGEPAGCVIEIAAMGEVEAAHRVAKKTAAAAAKKAAAMAGGAA